MAKYKIISICTVCYKLYVNAKNEEEAEKEYEKGNTYGFEEIDSWDDEINTIEKVK